MENNITENNFWYALNEPAPVIFINGYSDKIYEWRNEKGEIHRENDLPAFIRYYRNGNSKQKIWYQNGKRHRIGGPATIWYNEDGSCFIECWYLNGNMYTEEDYWQKFKEMGYE